MPHKGVREHQSSITEDPCAFGSPTRDCSAALPFHCSILSQIISEIWTTIFPFLSNFFSAAHLAPSEQRETPWVWSLAPGWWPVSLWPKRYFQKMSDRHANLRGTGSCQTSTGKLGQERPHICFHQRKGMFVETGNSGTYFPPCILLSL